MWKLSSNKNRSLCCHSTRCSLHSQADAKLPAGCLALQNWDKLTFLHFKGDNSRQDNMVTIVCFPSCSCLKRLVPESLKLMQEMKFCPSFHEFPYTAGDFPSIENFKVFCGEVDAFSVLSSSPQMSQHPDSEHQGRRVSCFLQLPQQSHLLF